MSFSVKTNNKLVAIVVPLSLQNQFSEAEIVSISHLLHYLKKYDKFFIAPPGSTISHPAFKKKYFDLKYFGSAEAHSKLLLSTIFYETFIEYEYILIYHLDALVFSDELSDWCRKGYDYIAAPWIKHEDAPYAGLPEFEGKTGNGGFSLRRVESFLKVLNSSKYFTDPDKYWRRFCKNKSAFKQFINLPRKYLMYLPQINNVKKEIKREGIIEDMFWSNRGSHYYPGFNIAPMNEALKFSFECVPRYCYEQNNYELPFGCHAWEKYDKEFWMPYLLTPKNK
jgi:hypothetical protein